MSGRDIVVDQQMPKVEPPPDETPEGLLARARAAEQEQYLKDCKEAEETLARLRLVPVAEVTVRSDGSPPEGRVLLLRRPTAVDEGASG